MNHFLNKKLSAGLLMVFVTALQSTAIHSAEEETRSLATPLCEVAGLVVAPPRLWYSVPIDTGEVSIEGCQMIWEEGEQFMGIMRLVSFETKSISAEFPKWEDFVIGFEKMVLEGMNIALGSVLWREESVPVAGDGFSNGKAIAFEVAFGDLTHKNEAHFLLFESATHKYVVSNLTPSKEASADVYEVNTNSMKTLMQTLQHGP